MCYMDRIDAVHDDGVGGERLRVGQATQGGKAYKGKAETLKAEMLKAEDRGRKTEGGGANIEHRTSNIEQCPVK